VFFFFFIYYITLFINCEIQNTDTLNYPER